MMKLKVLKKFHDKETDKMRNVGDVFEVSDERGKVILESHYHVAELVEKVETEKPVETETTIEKPKAKRNKK